MIATVNIHMGDDDAYVCDAKPLCGGDIVLDIKKRVHYGGATFFLPRSNRARLAFADQLEEAAEKIRELVGPEPNFVELSDGSMVRIGEPRDTDRNWETDKQEESND